MVAGRKANKRPSMFEVAKLAGVSHQTVSRVINNSPDVSTSTRAKVQRAIEQLDYRPSNSARALASHRSRTIVLSPAGRTSTALSPLLAPSNRLRARTACSCP